MSYVLRPYQEEAVTAALRYVDNPGKQYGVVVAPTGAGKSLVIAEIAHRLNSRILVLQPSKELLEQNYAKYISYGNKASVYSASMKMRETDERVIFGTIGTVYNNTTDFLDIKYVIIDECHLATKRGSLTAKFLAAVNVNKVIGLTATPLELRSSLEGGAYLQFLTRSRKNIFSDIIHITQINNINKKYWSVIDYLEADVDTSRLRLNSNGSDFTDNSIRDHYQHNNLKERIREEVYEALSSGRKSILIFMPSIDDAKEMEQIIPGCRAVYSGMDKKERQEIVDGFKNLTIPVVSNVNILSVGFDHPELDTVIMARATNSFAIYYQQAGRGVRIHPDKDDCLLIDFSENISRFGRLEEIEFLKSNKGKYEMYNKEFQLTGVITEKRSQSLEILPPNRMPFGMHKGKEIKNVPTKYLQWMIEKIDFNKPRDLTQLKQSVEEELHSRII